MNDSRKPCLSGRGYKRSRALAASQTFEVAEMLRIGAPSQYISTSELVKKPWFFHRANWPHGFPTNST
jgi:hypothetical protein